MDEFDVRLSRAKLFKDLCDAAFRVIQMYLVWALVWFFYERTGHWFAFSVAFFLVGVMFAYSASATQMAWLEFDNATKDRYPRWKFVAYILIIVWLACVFSALQNADPVVAVINDLTHPQHLSSQGRAG